MPSEATAGSSGSTPKLSRNSSPSRSQSFEAHFVGPYIEATIDAPRSQAAASSNVQGPRRIAAHLGICHDVCPVLFSDGCPYQAAARLFHTTPIYVLSASRYKKPTQPARALFASGVFVCYATTGCSHNIYQNFLRQGPAEMGKRPALFKLLMSDSTRSCGVKAMPPGFAPKAHLPNALKQGTDCWDQGKAKRGVQRGKFHPNSRICRRIALVGRAKTRRGARDESPIPVIPCKRACPRAFLHLGRSRRSLQRRPLLAQATHRRLAWPPASPPRMTRGHWMLRSPRGWPAEGLASGTKQVGSGSLP